MLESYACNPLSSRGRLYPEINNLSIINEFEVDRIRIIESTAFRRLEHKTQVFISHEGDHYRNRLTHSLEAAQIARTISKALNISANLAENTTLAHDLGHAPFGHAGEDALNDLMKPLGLEFNHNIHTIKLLTNLEKKFALFDGLNLTWEVLEGVAKHNGPLLETENFITSYSKIFDLELNSFPSLEAQVSSFADDIAYNNHDIDDGFRAGFLTIDDLLQVEIFGPIVAEMMSKYPNIEKHKIIHESVQRMKNIMILDLIAVTKNNIKNFAIETPEDIRQLGHSLAGFSQEIAAYNQQIKKFLTKRVYRHYSINRTCNKAKMILKKLFNLYMNDIDCLPLNWRGEVSPLLSDKEKAILICDFIACMTDRFAINEYRSFFDLSLNLY